MEFQKDPILVVGDDKMAFSIAVCLSQAGHVITLYTSNKADAFRVIETHLADLNTKPAGILDRNDFEIVDALNGASGFRMVIVITAEDAAVKSAKLKKAVKLGK